MLNKDQKRGLTIAIRLVEEKMQNIGHILNSEIHKGILYDTNCNIAPEIKEDMLKRVSLVKDRIKILSNLFALEKEYREGVRQIFGILSSGCEIVENVKSKRLKGYGDVQSGLDKVLDPQLNRIADLILEMEQLLVSVSK